MPAKRSIDLCIWPSSVPHRHFDSVRTSLEVLLDFFPPEPQDYPSLFLELLVDFLIPLNVTLYLCDPEVPILLDVLFVVLPVVPVPELAVAEHGHLLPDEHDVGLSGDVLDVLPVTQASGPELFPEQNLDLRILAADTGHVVVDLLGRLLHVRVKTYSGLYMRYEPGSYLLTFISIAWLNLQTGL